MVVRTPKPGPQVVTLADLSDREAAFAREYVEYVDRVGARGAGVEAVLAAGITSNRAAARVRASEMMRKPQVLQYIRDELTRKLNAGAVLGVTTLMNLCQNARSEQVKLGAARELVDRGYGPVMSRNATITATTTVEDWLRRLDEAQTTGELDGGPGDSAAHVIDVTPRAVDPGDRSDD